MRKSILVSLVILVFVGLFLVGCRNNSNHEGARLAMGDGLRQVGYIKIENAPDTPTQLKIERGKMKQITFLLTFVAHDPELTEVQVTLDPSSGFGYGLEQFYVVKGVNGEITERGSIQVVDLLRYTPSGTITIKAGETIPITVKVFMDLPEQVQAIQFPLGAVGIDAGEIPIIDATKVVVENE